MIRSLMMLAILGLSACRVGPMGSQRGYAPPVDRGQYVRPDYLNPVAPPIIPQTDECRSLLYQGLIGQPAGAVYIPGLPGSKRVLVPGIREDFDTDDDNPIQMGPTYVEVRDYQPGAAVYISSIRTPGQLNDVGEVDLTRLTLQLDPDGIIQAVRCG